MGQIQNKQHSQNPAVGFIMKSNADYLKFVTAFCNYISENYHLNPYIPSDIIWIITRYCLMDSFDIEITDKQLQGSVLINPKHTILTTLPQNSISTVYGNMIIKNNDIYSWTLRRNTFYNINRNFFFGVIKNDIECLYGHIHNLGWNGSDGYLMDICSLIDVFGNKINYDHQIDVRIQITLDLKKNVLSFDLLINGKVVKRCKMEHIKKDEYRLAVCLAGEGLQVQIC